MPDPTHHQILKAVWQDAGAWSEFIEAMRRSIVPESPPPKIPVETTQNEWIMLPILCCEAAGGDLEHAQTVSLAWGLLYTAAHLMDSVADHDEVPAWMGKLGPGAIINIATGLYATSSLVLAESFGERIEAGVVRRIQNEFNRTILQMCSGQHLDLSDTCQDLDTYWRVVRAKSGAIFELACTSGARLATEDDRLISLYGEYGSHLGIMVQICDDASELWSKRDGGQPRMNCSSIPIAYTMEVLSGGELKRFHDYLEHSKDDAHSAAMVCEIVEQAGAALYVQTKFQYHRQLARQALRAIGARHPIYEKLVDYVNNLSLKV